MNQKIQDFRRLAIIGQTSLDTKFHLAAMYNGIIKHLEKPLMCMCDGCGKESIMKIGLRENSDKSIIFKFCSVMCADWFRSEGFRDNIVIYLEYDLEYYTYLQKEKNN